MKFVYSTSIISDEDELLFFFFYCQNSCELLLCENCEIFEQFLKFFKTRCILTNFSNNYTYKKLLGKGAFAKVVLCSRISDNQQFAVKIFDKKLINKSKDYIKIIKGILKEINILQEIDHPNIIKLYEVYEGQGHLYLVLELLTGGELFKKIVNDDQFTEETVCNLMRNLLFALNYLHAKNIMHRDIKPENIIIRNKGVPFSEIVLADFGLAEFANQEEYLFKRCGTPGYVAPEVLNDLKYDTKVDVFSAGVIMYMLLTGNSLFFGESYLKILNLNKKCQIDFDFELMKVNISKNAEDLLQKMLAKDQTQRININDALKHPWFIENNESIQTKLHNESMQKLSQQMQIINNQILQSFRRQIIQHTKPQEMNDSQNIISNSPIMNGMPSNLSPTQSPSKFSPTSNVISPQPVVEKKSSFQTMRNNFDQLKKFGDFNVSNLKEKIQQSTK